MKKILSRANLLNFQLIIACVAVSVLVPVAAKSQLPTRSSSVRSIQNTNHRQIAQAATPVKIVAVKLKATATGVEVILETPTGTLVQPVPQTVENSVTLDIANATLALPNRQEFASENPSPNVANVRVTQLNPDTVRVQVTGTSGVPTASIIYNSGNLRADGSPENSEETIDINVIGISKPLRSVGSKTGTSLRDIPATIEVISPQAIKAQGAIDLDRAVTASPSVQRTGGGSYGFGNTYLIRGLTNSFTRDGVPDSQNFNGYFRTLIDVDSIEILKGPGSSLYGSSSPGGTINLVTKKPQVTPAGRVDLIGGGLGTIGTIVDFTGPLNDDKSLLYRFNGGYTSTDGFRGLNNQTTEIRPKITWKPNDYNTVNVSVGYQQTDNKSDVYGIPFQGASASLLNVPRNTRYYSPFGKGSQTVYSGAINHEWRVHPDLLVRNNLVLLNRDFRFARNADGGVLANFGSTSIPLNYREQTDKTLDLTYQTEAVWKTKTGNVKHTVLGGVEYQYKNYATVRDTSVFDPIVNPLNPVLAQSIGDRRSVRRNFDLRILANYLGLYVQDEVELSSQLKARVGGRLDSFGLSQSGTFGTTTTPSNQAPLRFSYQAGLTYQPIREVSVYGGVSTSNLGTLTTETVAAVVDRPESALQYEIGAKTELFDGKLAANLSFFDVTRQDFTIPLAGVRTPIGAQKTRGMELDFNAKPANGWNLYGGLTLYDARLTNLPNTPLFNGNRPTGIPNAAASFGSSYEIQSGALKGLGLGGGLTYRDSLFLDQGNRAVVPGFTTLDLALFYRKEDFEAQLNFYNVTDATYFLNGVNNGALPGNPFTVKGTVSFKF